MAYENVDSIHQHTSDIQNESCRMLLPIEGYDEFPLLPLDVSVEPIEEIIPNVARNAWIAKENTDANPPDGLSQEESASIHLCTMEWRSNNRSLHRCLNEALRARDRNRLVPYFGYLKLILTALRKLESVRKTVWHSVKADLSSHYPIGKTLVWWGFSLCTKSLTSLESESFLSHTGPKTLFNIECKSGKEIYRHSYFGDKNEVLLLPAIQFRVRGKMNPAPGFYIIHLQETAPLFPLIQSPFSNSTTSTESIVIGANGDIKNKKSVRFSSSYMGSTQPSHLPTERPLYHVPSSTQTYHNQELETLIQQKCTLSFIDFSEKQLNNEDVCLIANELARNIHWEILNLSRNNIGMVGAASLSRALESNSTLLRLVLDCNDVGDGGVTCLASVLRSNRSLEELSLQNNKITDIGATELANALKYNKSLQILLLEANQIQDAGMVVLAEVYKWNTTLKRLSLNTNRITDRSVGAIVNTLLQTKTLDFLYLINNNFSADGSTALIQAAKRSKTSLYLQ